MVNLIIIILGKLLSTILKFLNLGSGSTWPGHLALSLNKKFISQSISGKNNKIILIAGTNGKTTTSLLIKTVMENSGMDVLHNDTGANLVNGMASIIIKNSSWSGKIENKYIVFEADENALPHIMEQITPDYILLLNLFRDQLDRYGEINTIIYRWKKALAALPASPKLILNADDPQIAFLGKDLNKKILYFGSDTFPEKYITHEADSVTCPNCSKNLAFDGLSYAHLGNWRCRYCGSHRPKPDIDSFEKYPLLGNYNRYNTLAAVLLLQELGIKKQTILIALNNFKPAFGRQEKIIYKGINIHIFLSKNPTGFNQSLKTIIELSGEHILFVLNDRIPDGRDVSWIWDTDLSHLNKFKNIFIAGDRCFDMALRLKYELGNYNSISNIYTNLHKAIESARSTIPHGKTLYIMPTYSAMLEARKILTGKKIL